MQWILITINWFYFKIIFFNYSFYQMLAKRGPSGIKCRQKLCIFSVKSMNPVFYFRALQNDYRRNYTFTCHFWCRIHLWFRLMGGSASRVDDVTALPCRKQDGGYALLWQRYDNNKMAAIFYIFNSTVIDWTFFYVCGLLLKRKCCWSLIFTIVACVFI